MYDEGDQVVTVMSAQAVAVPACDGPGAAGVVEEDVHGADGGHGSGSHG
jgi:hypothetical protein